MEEQINIKSQFEQLLEKYGLPKDRYYRKRDEFVSIFVKNAEELKSDQEKLQKMTQSFQDKLAEKQRELADPEEQNGDSRKELIMAIATYQDKIDIFNHFLTTR